MGKGMGKGVREEGGRRVALEGQEVGRGSVWPRGKEWGGEGRDQFCRAGRGGGEGKMEASVERLSFRGKRSSAPSAVRRGHVRAMGAFWWRCVHFGGGARTFFRAHLPCSLPLSPLAPFEGRVDCASSPPHSSPPTSLPHPTSSPPSTPRALDLPPSPPIPSHLPSLAPPTLPFTRPSLTHICSLSAPDIASLPVGRVGRGRGKGRDRFGRADEEEGEGGGRRN